MAKVRASLADISTDFTPKDPGLYEAEIKEVVETELDDDRIRYDVKMEITGVVEDGVIQPSDYNGNKINDFIHIHTKEGELNEVGLAQLKRYALASVGEDRANSDDFDTDEMIHSRVVLDVIIDTYKDKNTKQERKTNRIRGVSNPDDVA